MGAGKYDTKYGVGIMLNKRWRKRIVDTEQINERAITTTIVVNRQRIKLMSEYFLFSRCMRTITSRKCTRRSRNTRRAVINTFQSIIGGDFNADLGPGKGTERKSVGRYTLKETNKRGDWVKSWLMLNDYSALSTMFRKTPRLSKRKRKTN